MNQAGFAMTDNWDYARQLRQGDGPFSTFEHLENYPGSNGTIPRAPLQNLLESNSLERSSFPFLSHTISSPSFTTEIPAPQLPDIYSPYNFTTSQTSLPFTPLLPPLHIALTTTATPPPYPSTPELYHTELDDLDSPVVEADKTSKRKVKAPPKKRKAPEKKEPSENVCPICHQELDPLDFDVHYAMELARLDQVPEKPAEKTRGKREAALNARVKVQLQTQVLKPRARGARNSKPPVESLNPEDALRTVRRNRQTRSGNHSIVSEADAVGGSRGASVCPLCKLRIHGDSDDINRHIDLCLSANEGRSPASTRNSKRSKRLAEDADSEEFEVYTMAGQTRVRASSGLEGGHAGALDLKKRIRVEDESGELDVDGDDSKEFGQGQYSEVDLLAPVEDLDFATTTTPSPFEPNQDSGFVIESLKSRIRDLEHNVSGAGKCLICLGWYNKPCVSIGCWHVLCEQCWLTTLGAKKLCPLCKVITAPDNLRRIFL